MTIDNNIILNQWEQLILKRSRERIHIESGVALNSKEARNEYNRMDICLRWSVANELVGELLKEIKNLKNDDAWDL